MSRPSGWLPRSRLSVLLASLAERCERVVGPRVIDGVIRFEDIHAVTDLPTGVIDLHKPGRYLLDTTDGPRHFSWSNGPQGIKPLVFSPAEPLWQVTRDAGGKLCFEACPADPPLTAVIGVRACDLAALQLQDRHFLDPENPDANYAARRANLLLVAVHCSHPGATCFCNSTGDGPAASEGFDLALAELDDGFIVEAGSPAGELIMATLDLGALAPEHRRLADEERAQAAAKQQRRLPPGDLWDVLSQRLDHPRWADVAERCLGCGSCTAVCPSCFCNKEFDAPALDGGQSEHRREWDSCFSPQHSAMCGHQVREGIRQRYRQWLTHKLGGWHRQFGRSGCVGCGRCISWCPAGIDITREVTALLEDAHG